MDAPAILSPAQRTREALLDAGEHLAESGGIAHLTVQRITAAAGVAKGTFYLHFEDRDAYIRALHERFYGRVQEAIDAARGAARPGDEAWTAVEAYLDACLRNRAVRILLLEARNDGVLTDARVARRRAFVDDAEQALAALGYERPRASASLLLAMVSEIALQEAQAGHPDPDARAALLAFLRGAAQRE